MKWTDRVSSYDRYIASWMSYYGHRLLRYSLAIIFLWFGLLKAFGMSPAAELVAHTVYWFPPDVFVPILGLWEAAIGVGLLFRPLVRVALFLLFIQMPGTALPLVLLPDVCFSSFPLGLTLEGQYIIKNLAVISAAIVIGGSVRHRAGNHQLL